MPKNRGLCAVYAVLTLAIAIMPVAGCGKDPAAPSNDDPCLGFGDSCCDVLLIGNSLTAYNDTPATIQELADSAGVEMNVQLAIYLGHSLQDIVDRGDVFDRIKLEKWDYVLLQGSDYTVAFPEYHYEILPPIETLADSIYANEPCTKIVFFMDWCLQDGIDLLSGEHLTFHEFQVMIRSGTLVLADNMGFMVAPCGVAWDVVLAAHPEIILHDPDGGHPGPKGSYLNACVYFSTFTQRSAVGIDVSGGFTPEETALFQSVGSATVLDSLKLWNIR
ncbi:MAG: hypothetical protein MUF59_05695 [Candidatus Krumholzibacteria bacterium]|jgi:hypothetical protein|nr:hypothetical protein [Candidatus Krumholzibacteria bacterium]